MQKTKNHYIKYTRLELENYTKCPESCVQKINTVEPIRFSPTVITDFKSSILRILSRKIGKFDVRLNGIVLDFRNTKILGTQSGIRQDSAFSVINVETNFYVFSPRKGAVVTGVMKYVNRMSMETVISVLIYRVFNVKVTIKGKIKNEIEKNQEIQIRVKDFHFDNVIPYIEGEIVDSGFITKVPSRKIFDDAIDSGISESSITSEMPKDLFGASTSGIQPLRIKKERESSVESSSAKQNTSRKRKPQSDSDSDEASPPPSAKKVKVERKSPAKDVSQLLTKVKQEKFSESEEEIAKKSKKSLDSSTLTSSKHKEKKSKKKKKKKRTDDNSDDDFEKSLQNILNSAIKKYEL